MKTDDIGGYHYSNGTPIGTQDSLTPNQAYKVAKAGGENRTFADWLQEQKDKGLFEKGKEILAVLISSKAVPQPKAGDVLPPKETLFLGMKPWVAITIGVGLAGLVGFGIYSLVRARKK